MFKPALNSFIFISLFIASLCLALLTPAYAVDKPSTHFGVHGMILFGGDDALFASHLPMYHQPHNVQMVMRFHFTNKQVDQAVRQQLQTQSTAAKQLWTIIPKPFDLMTLKPDSNSVMPELSVDVVQGHFERGGQRQFSAQEIVIDEVILFSTLNTQKGQAKANNAQYLRIAAGHDSQNQFLIKRLTNRPEADHLLRIINPVVSSSALLTVPRMLTFSSEAEIAKALNRHSDNHYSPENLIEIYLETAELQ